MIPVQIYNTCTGTCSYTGSFQMEKRFLTPKNVHGWLKKLENYRNFRKKHIILDSLNYSFHCETPMKRAVWNFQSNKSSQWFLPEQNHIKELYFPVSVMSLQSIFSRHRKMNPSRIQRELEAHSIMKEKSQSVVVPLGQMFLEEESMSRRAMKQIPLVIPHIAAKKKIYNFYYSLLLHDKWLKQTVTFYKIVIRENFK